jgi:Tfp pilus assembly protein PilO
VTKLNRTKLLLLVLAAALVALALKYAWPHMQSLTGEADSVRAEAAAVDNRLAEIAEFRADRDDKGAELAQLTAAIPADPALNDVIDTLQLLADTSGVRWQSDAPQPTGATAEADGAQVWTVSAALVGTPSAVRTFLDALADAPRLFVVDDLSLTQGTSDAVSASASVLVFATGDAEAGQ